MSVSFPTRVKLVYSYGFVPYTPTYDESPTQTGEQIFRGAPAPGSSSKVDLPSIFYEGSEQQGGHDVCHASMLSIGFETVDGKPLAYGTYCSDYSKYSGGSGGYRTFTTYWWARGYLYRLDAQTMRYYNEYHYRTYLYVYEGSSSNYANMCQAYVAARIYSSGINFVSTSGDSLLVAEMKVAMRAAPTPQYPERVPPVSVAVNYHNAVLAYIQAIPDLRPLSWNQRYTGEIVGSRAITPSVSLENYLLFDELSLLRDGFSMKPYAEYHIHAMESLAYLDALDHVPELNDNSLANILEVLSFIKGIVIDHQIEIPKSLSSAWLAYRYEYTTTKLDIKEASSFVKRMYGNDLLGNGFSCYGSTSYTFKEVTVIARCRLDIKQKELGYIDKILDGLSRYGLSPDFYLIWDMIPYSFIVDWIIPVGDILDSYDKTILYERNYDITNIWYSVKYTYSSEVGPIKSYSRWSGSTPPEFHGFYTLENKGTTSSKVIGYRILDALSLAFR